MGFLSLLQKLHAARHWAAGMLWVGFCSAGGAQEATAQAPRGAASSAAVAHTVWGILGYTRWPENTPAVQLCVAGDSPHAALLLNGTELPGGRVVQARRIRSEERQPLEGCHALYAGTLRRGQWQHLMSVWPSGQPLLTLSEHAADCQQGGMFCLDTAQPNVSFELNLDSMARSGVRVNPRVLGLALRKEGH